MAGEAQVGSIIGYLRLDRSDWDAELTAAGRKADDLARHNPDIRIRTNAPSAIAQLAAVAAATKRLQDAQGAEAVAEAKLQSLRDRGITDAGRLKAAEEAVMKARRSEAAATIALAAAQDANDRAVQKATADTDKLAKKADEAKNTFTVGLIPALAAVAPAAVPIAAVAGGALIGLAPVAATVMLAVKGIGNQMKAGALQGTQFASSVNTLKGELTTLETTAAGGIMVGVNKAMSESAPLFHTVNQDVAVMSGQLGQIVAGAAPALVRILTDLNPLFVTFGNLLANGASRLDHWAQSSTGMQSFVAYVQTELPTVLSLVGNLVVLSSHLVQALAPMGGAILTDLNVLVRLLDMIPVPVLQAAAPAVLAVYAALVTLTKLTPGVSSIGGAIKALGNTIELTGPRAEAAAAQQTAAALAVQAASAAEAAQVARDKATEAAAAAEAAVEIAAAQEAINSAFAEGTAASAAAAIEFSATMEANAVAAETEAAEIAASAQAAADSVAASGEAAAVSWTAMLGPLAAVGVGLVLLTSLFTHNSQQAQQNAKIQNSYADSLRQSADALAQVNIQTTLKNLKDAGAVTLGNQLGVSQAQLAIAVNGTTAQFNAQITALDRIAAAHTIVKDIQNASDPRAEAQATRGATSAYDDQGQAALKLAGILKNLHSNLSQAEKDQEALAQAQKQAQIVIDGGSTAVAQQARMYGVTTDAYLAAQQAAQQNTAQTQAQTLAFQLENDAASLVNQALQTMAGQNLSNAQAQTAMEQAILTATQALQTNKGALDQHSTAGLADRQAIEGAVSAIRAKMTAEAQATGSTEKATAQYRTNAAALLDQIGKLDGTKSAAYRYAQQLLAIPPVVKTRLDLQGDAINKINAAMYALRGLNNKTFRAFLVVQASTKNAQLMKQLDQYGPTPPPPTAGGHRYAVGTNDAPAGWAWVGEQGPELVNLPAHAKVMPHAQSMAAAAGKPAIVQNIYPQPGQSEREIGRAAGDEIAWALAR